MRHIGLLLFCLCLGLPLASGCGSEEDLGTVLPEVPRVAGADRPLKMPELDDASTVDAHPQQTLSTTSKQAPVQGK